MAKEGNALAFWKNRETTSDPRKKYDIMERNAPASKSDQSVSRFGTVIGMKSTNSSQNSQLKLEDIFEKN